MKFVAGPLFGLLLHVLVSLPALGQVAKGTYEANLRGTFSTISTSSSSTTKLILDPRVGYFVTDGLEIGVDSQLRMGSGDFIVKLLAFGALHVKRIGSSLYYLGLRGGGTGFEDEYNESSVGVFLGVKTLFSEEHAALVVEPFFLYSNPVEGLDRREYGVSTGFSVFFH